MSYQHVPASTNIADRSFENEAYAKVTLRLIPFLFLCYIVAYLDRVNVGFAKLQMLSDLGFSDAIYGLGAGIFFVGYFLFEVPSNLILHRVGARLWIARIMITWGIVSGATAFISTPAMFYVMRFILGITEAGFFPGIILYLTYWYPSHRRARIVALFMSAAPVSGVIGGPLSGWILSAMTGNHGLAGWQWLFILEAVPSIVIGIAVFFVLRDRVTEAMWLTENEKKLIKSQTEKEVYENKQCGLVGVLKIGKVWLLATIYFSFVMGLYGIGFWLPTIIKNTGVSSAVEIGFLSAIPYAASVGFMILMSISADKCRERRWHVVVSGVLGFVGLALTAAFPQSTLIATSGLAVATCGIMACLSLFWSLPTAFLGGTAAAAGIALINSLGNLAGFVGPYLVGWIKGITVGIHPAIYALSIFMLLGALLTLAIPSRLVNR